jgi:rhamnogalacturonyl hydrolase YesR
LAGLARTLPFVPADHPSRSRYVALFGSMADAVLRAQQPDGFWRSSLLDPQAHPQGESSATALFTFALAWGVNEGLLPASDYKPAIERAWAALSGAVTEEGRLGWLQREAREPGDARRFDWDPFGSGALLLAGAELMRSATSGGLGPAAGTARP